MALCLSLFAFPGKAEAANKTLLVEQARRMALANSPDVQSKSNEIILKKMDYVEAVDKIQAKVQNKKTFRWTPLLSFKFPQALNMSEEYDLNIKPLNLQAEIQTMQHALADLTWQVYCDTNKLYANIYVEQEKIKFTKERLENAKNELARNQARLVAGGAKQDDIDKMQSGVDALTSELAELERSFLSDKQKLSDSIGMDVTTGYVFRNSLQTLNLPREQLDSVIHYTLDNDQGYYEVKANYAAAKLNLNAYESLMKNHFGSKMDYINRYIQAAKQGQNIDYAAFKLSYKDMLKAADNPWNGNIRILFIKIPKIWFKGEIAGTRYIEDDMYAVYTACMEYSNATKTMQNAAKELRANVTSSYEALVTAYNAYSSAQKLTDTAKKTYEKVLALNKLGKADYSELKEARESYEEQQLDTVTSLASYNELLYEFDRLACGGVSKYFSGEGTSMSGGGTGDSFSTIDPIAEPYYYIYSSVADLTFYIGVSIPKDYEPAITAFEVWIGDTQIGERTEIGKELRHLALDYADSSELTIRLYDGDKYVTECKIDATVPRAVLPISTETEGPSEEVELGTYTLTSTTIGSISTSKLTLKLSGSGAKAKKYSLEYGENGVLRTTEAMDVSEDFTYLSILVKSLDGVTLKLSDDSGNPLYTGRFDTATQTIYGTPVK
jgi:hypothetical protein